MFTFFRFGLRSPFCQPHEFKFLFDNNKRKNVSRQMSLGVWVLGNWGNSFMEMRKTPRISQLT